MVVGHDVSVFGHDEPTAAGRLHFWKVSLVTLRLPEETTKRVRDFAVGRKPGLTTRLDTHHRGCHGLGDVDEGVAQVEGRLYGSRRNLGLGLDRRHRERRTGEAELRSEADPEEKGHGHRQGHLGLGSQRIVEVFLAAHLVVLLAGFPQESPAA